MEALKKNDLRILLATSCRGRSARRTWETMRRGSHPWIRNRAGAERRGTGTEGIRRLEMRDKGAGGDSLEGGGVRPVRGEERVVVVASRASEGGEWFVSNCEDLHAQESVA